MPKKFGTNSKAEEARAKQYTAKKDAADKRAQEKEDAKWAETDPKVLAKEKKKKEEEERRLAQLQKRAELKALEQKEQEELAKQYKKPVQKLTKAQIEEEKQRELRLKAAAEKKAKDEDDLPPLEENINHILRDEYLKLEDGDHVSARSIEEAVSKLDVGGKGDKHPEKRLRAAFTAYETKMMPSLKADNPGLKLSQLKELLWKQWQKAPENPLNQARE